MNHNKRYSSLVIMLGLLVILMMWQPSYAQTTGADLAISNSLNNALPADGSTVIYTLTATNNGTDPATAVTVTDALPSGLTYVSDDGAGAYVGGVWTIGNLAANSSVVLNITASVNTNTDGDTVTNTATISGAQADPNPGNNSASSQLTVRINDLCAVAGSTAMPNAAAINIWGYTPGDCTRGLPAQLPGPTIIVNEGDTVNLTLHNNLAETTAVLFQGQATPPDLIGAAAAGGTRSYSFIASEPGTFLYEAGLLTNAQHQVAMGLYGALIVNSATSGQAYDNASTAFDDQAVLVLSEIDPALNNSANPATFDMRNFKPRYWLINGKAYPQTAVIATDAGRTVLLRYINAGLQYHSMAVLGLRQNIIGLDGSALTYARPMVAETFGPGQTADTLTTIPASTPAGSKFALYDGNLLLHNSNSTGFGGMLTFLTTSIGPTGGDTTGPSASALALSPNPTNGSSNVTLSATLSDVNSGGANVQAAEYRIDSPNGTPTPMAGGFGSPTANVNGTISTATLAGLSSGSHTIYVRGQDALGNWGPNNFIILNLDRTGPAISGPSLTPNPSNGTVNVALHATANDQNSGNSNIVAGEYFIDSTGAPGTGIPMSVNVANPVASLDATLTAATVNALSAGSHTVSIRAQDALGNWGTFGTILLIVDKTGPTTSGVAAVPNPNNGTQGVNSNTPAVRLTASVNDAVSTISAAEGFIDTVNSNGTGFPMTAVDGVFNSQTEAISVDIPLSTIILLSDGSHTLYVHGKDAAGNWGATSNTVLVVDKTKPVLSNVAASPNPTNTTLTNNTSFNLTATVTDAVTNIAAAEWYEGADPGAGNGNPMTGAFTSHVVNVSATINFVTLGWTPGNHTLYVRAKDSANNWSTVVSVVVNVVMPNSIFADSFESANFAAWNGSATGNVSVSTAAAMVGTYGMQATVNGNTPAYVTDNTPNAETSYHGRFYFNPHSTLTGNNQMFIIFSGLNAANTPIFQVEYRRQNSGGGTYQVRLSVLRANGTTSTNFFNISNNASHVIEVFWQSGTNVSASFYTDGTLRQTLTGLNTSANLLETVRLGPSTGMTNAASGTLYFDAFASTRRSVIGP